MAILTRLPVVAVIGRPNVGKSTFFNRVVGGMRAVVHDLPGVTRDRNEATASWREIPFTLVDTGGLIPDAKSGMTAAVRHQTEKALADADLLLLLVDGLEGLTALDRDIAEAIRRIGRPCLLVVNKVDTVRSESAIHEFVPLCESFGQAEAVGHQYERRVLIPMELQKQRGHRIGRLAIQVARWLVRKQQRRSVDQCPRQGDPLSLTA